MMIPTRPRLRPYLAKEKAARSALHFHLIDQLGLVPPLPLTAEEFRWLEVFDGTRDLTEMAETQKGFAHRLDENLMLEGPRYRQAVESPVRLPRCIGCYSGDPESLRRQITGFFTAREGPGLPDPGRPGRHLRAALIPHIDYPRGGITYAWGFKEIMEQTAASLFIIIGTSHYSQHRFTLTRKNFQTPLGIAQTDQGVIDRLVGHYGPGLFDDELLAHLPEHSIELEVVFLQYLLENKRSFRIVPLVVGSFHDCIVTGKAPSACHDIARMVEALRKVEEETSEPICYIISGDLAHIGPKFQDSVPLTSARLQQSRKQDLAIMSQAEEVRPSRYFQVIADEGDERNICGLSPTYTFLEAIRPSKGKLLHYDQYVHPQGHESVSFASMAFYKNE
jgi:AmmeMemoRadiSam system protein B